MEAVVNHRAEIAEFLLRLADDRLILGHRLSEWCGHAPILEEDIALANISLDCIGQGVNLYTAAAETEGKGRTPDNYVYFREAIQYRNLLLVEQPNGDFAQTIVRQFLYDAFGVLLFDALQKSSFRPLAGIAQKSVKELRYHFRHSGKWVVRLGDGTEESHRRAQRAVDVLWCYTDEMFENDSLGEILEREHIAVLPGSLKDQWKESVEDTLGIASLHLPSSKSPRQRGGRSGLHTEHLGHLLAEMQIVARSFPEITW